MEGTVLAEGAVVDVLGSLPGWFRRAAEATGDLNLGVLRTSRFLGGPPKWKHGAQGAPHTRPVPVLRSGARARVFCFVFPSPPVLPGPS